MYCLLSTAGRVGRRADKEAHLENGISLDVTSPSLTFSNSGSFISVLPLRTISPSFWRGGVDGVFAKLTWCSVAIMSYVLWCKCGALIEAVPVKMIQDGLIYSGMRSSMYETFTTREAAAASGRC
jgi:hypothetical protein